VRECLSDEGTADRRRGEIHQGKKGRDGHEEKKAKSTLVQNSVNLHYILLTS
jgi:hypothetical protein